MGLLEDVLSGLSAPQKHISSKYFYDAQGDALFQAIMKLPEYYLTNSEFEILSEQAGAMLEALNLEDRTFDLVELGAGDGFKTKILVEKLLEAGANMRYVPIDISSDVLEGLKQNFENLFPNLEIEPENGEYLEALDRVNTNSENPKLLLFLGSSIGNFDATQALAFLKELEAKLKSGDKLLVGFDLKKNPQIILDAYNDAQGVTRAFNLNLLTRLNRELDADFQLDAFEHYPLYDPESGMAKSYLVSKKEQTIQIGKAKAEFHFDSGETIHTEVSKKFSLTEIEEMAARAGLKHVQHFFDSRHYFVNSLFEKP